MKKGIAFILVLALSLSLCACSGGEPQKTETIGITTENWQDYFVVKLAATIYKDDFGDYNNGFANYYIYLKEEYRDKIVSADVAFGWHLSEYGNCQFKYDLETGALSYSDFKPTSTGMGEQEDDGTCSFVYGEGKQKVYVKISPRITTGTTTDSFSANAATAIWEGQLWGKVEIIKVQGSITIME